MSADREVSEGGLPGTWNEPDGEALDRLTHMAMFAADGEAMKPGPPSSIRNPDGSQQGETPHESPGSRGQKYVSESCASV
jgi:hypothetical protein